MVCDPLGDYNVWASTRPLNNTAKGHKMWESVVIAAARVSSRKRVLFLLNWSKSDKIGPCQHFTTVQHLLWVHEKRSVVISLTLEAFQYKSRVQDKVLLCNVCHVTLQSQIQSVLVAVFLFFASYYWEQAMWTKHIDESDDIAVQWDKLWNWVQYWTTNDLMMVTTNQKTMEFHIRELYLRYYTHELVK